MAKQSDFCGSWGDCQLPCPRDPQVTVGCLLFLLAGDISSKRASEKTDSIYGLLLMVGYLGCARRRTPRTAH